LMWLLVVRTSGGDSFQLPGFSWHHMLIKKTV